MKLAKVTHDRCNEYTATTYLMVPDELTEEQFRKAVRQAQKDYDAAAAQWLAANEAPPLWYNNSIDNYPADWTVAQIKSDRAEKEAARKEWEKARSEGIQSYAVHLLRLIPGAKYLWEDEACDLDGYVSWGHRHGQYVSMGETKDSDLKGIAVQKDD